MRFIDVRASDGKVPSVNHILDRQRSLARIAAPAVIARFGDAYRLTRTLSGYGFDLSGEISNKIAAGYPRRHRQPLALRIRLSNG